MFEIFKDIFAVIGLIAVGIVIYGLVTVAENPEDFLR